MAAPKKPKGKTEKKAVKARPAESVPPSSAQTAPPRPLIDPFNDKRLLDYYYEIAKFHGYLNFLSMPHLQDVPDVPIARLYVEPEVSERHIRPEEPTRNWGATQNILDTFAENRAVVLLGDPGSGKSTLVSWLAWQFTRTDETSWTMRFGRLVPIPIILRDLSIDASITWNRLLDRFLAQPVAKPLGGRDFLEDLLERGQAFIMLDGIDEIGSVEIRRNLHAAVLEGASRYVEKESNRWLLTSRVVGYETVRFDHTYISLPAELINSEESFWKEGFEVLDFRSTDQREAVSKITKMAHPLSRMSVWLSQEENMETLSVGTSAHQRPEKKLSLKSGLSFPKVNIAHTSIAESIGMSWAKIRYLVPFNDQPIARFAFNWYIQHERASEVREKKANDLIKAIHRDTSTECLARIPNLLTLMALIHRIEAHLPHGRAILYNKIAEAYLEGIDKFRGLEETPYSWQQKRRWLAWVAYRAQCRRAEQTEEQREILLERQELLGWFCEAMTREGINDPAEAERLVDHLGRRSGLLFPRGPDQFAFIHLSFQEYLAACFLATHVTSRAFILASYDASRPVPKGTPAPDDIRHYVDLPVWQETFVFLFEILAAEPPKPDELLEMIYGSGCERILDNTQGYFPRELSEDHETGTPAAVLLARISVDPHSGICPGLRNKAWEACWRSEIRQKNMARHISFAAIADALFRAESAELTGVWNAFCVVLNQKEKSSISFARCAGLSDLTPIAKCNELQYLHLSGCSAITDIAPIANCKELKYLDLSGCSAITDLTPIASCKNLQWLDLSGCSAITDLAPIAKCKELKHLELNRCSAITELAPIASCKKLQILNLTGCNAISDLAIIAACKNLKILLLIKCTAISDFSPIAACKNLQQLYLGFCTAITELAPIAACKNLLYLFLNNCTAITDIAPIADCHKLELLLLKGCSAITDIAPLGSLKKLRLLDLGDCPGIKKIPDSLLGRKNLEIRHDLPSEEQG